MTRLAALVTRRSYAREHREDRVVEARRACELPLAPLPGMLLDFGAAGEVTISKVRVRVPLATRLGVQPLEVEVIGTKEPMDGLAAAEAAGWQTEAAPAPPEAA